MKKLRSWIFRSQKQQQAEQQPKTLHHFTQEKVSAIMKQVLEDFSKGHHLSLSENEYQMLIQRVEESFAEKQEYDVLRISLKGITLRRKEVSFVLRRSYVESDKVVLFFQTQYDTPCSETFALPSL